MTIIYAIKADQKKAEKAAKSEHVFRIDTPHGFKKVDYNASKVIIIGNHPKVEKAYRGIMPVHVIEELDDSEPIETEESDEEQPE